MREEIAAVALDLGNWRIRADQLAEQVDAAGSAVAGPDHRAGAQLAFHRCLPAGDVGLIEVIVHAVHRLGRVAALRRLQDVREAGAPEDQDAVEQRRRADTGDGQLSAAELVVEDAEAAAGDCACVADRIERDRDPRREIVFRGVLPKRSADRRLGIVDVVAQHGDLAVHLGGRRDRLVAHPHADAKDVEHPELMLEVAEVLVVAPAPDGVRTGLHHFGDTRPGLQQQCQRVEGIGADRAEVRALVKAHAVVARAHAQGALASGAHHGGAELVALENEAARPSTGLEAAHIAKPIDRDRAHRLALDKR